MVVGIGYISMKLSSEDFSFFNNCTNFGGIVMGVEAGRGLVLGIGWEVNEELWAALRWFI